MNVLEPALKFVPLPSLMLVASLVLRTARSYHIYVTDGAIDDVELKKLSHKKDLSRREK